MKKRLILAIIASILVLGLTAGGTIMYFYSTSNIATNTVDLGNLKVQIWEKGGVPTPIPTPYETGKDKEKFEENRFELIEDSGELYTIGGPYKKYTEIAGDKTGIQYDYIVPNGWIIKDPIVKNLGSTVDSYIRVKCTVEVYEIKVSQIPPSPLKVADLISAKVKDTSLYSLLLRLFNEVNVNQTCWEYVDASDEINLAGYYYYTDGDWKDNNVPLKTLKAPATGKENATERIFGPEIHIPNFIDDEAEFLQNYTIKVKLEAEAIQSAFNSEASATNLTTKSGWEKIFKDVSAATPDITPTPTPEPAP
ncbi:MAG: SipW-dependent-type signal peptide-containing protein [Clostridiales bacterium]|jgi:predicted ribosomally synthesized peptide with SipW-like signal peptide|nr:SipW-dependent-type signal peptide-containing protein [Clostridiales bacterium]